MSNDHEQMQIVGRKIKQLRKLNNITQEDLRKELGYKSTGMISQIESGRKGMSYDKIIHLSKILGINPEEFFKDMAMSEEDIEMVGLFIQKIKNKDEDYEWFKKTFTKILKP